MFSLTSIQYDVQIPSKQMQPIGRICFPQIPWLEQHGAIKEFAQSRMAEITHNTNVAKNKQELFMAMCHAVPFYLPASYHQMVCKSLKNARLVDIKMHWDVTFRFLYCCYKYDHDYMATAFKKAAVSPITKFEGLATIGVHQMHFGSGEFKPELSANAAQFLLEPWFLLQIPFQPVLLHQWAVTLHAEALIFQRKISPVFCYGFPATLSKVAKNLEIMLLAMKSCANFTLKLYETMCTKGLTNNFHSVLQPEFEAFSNHLTKVLPILSFVTGKVANSVIGDIVKMCVEELNEGGEVQPPQVVLQTSKEQPTPLYDFWFWTKECDTKEFFSGAKNDRNRCNSELFEGSGNNKSFARMNCQLESARLNALMVLVDTEIIQTGRLEGVDGDVIMAAVEKNAVALNIFSVHVCQYFDTSSEGLKMKEGIFGVLNNIICLYSDVKISEALDLLIRRIFDEVKKTHPAVKISIPTQQIGVEHTIPNIEGRFEQILRNQEWTWDKILADAKSTCGSSSKERNFISTNNFLPKKATQHFQDRIRVLVHKIAERHLTSLKADRFEFVPEHLFVQYVLPCFVLYFLCLCKHSSAKLTAKQKFMRFVDQLISSYENKLYIQVLSVEKLFAVQIQRGPPHHIIITEFTDVEILNKLLRTYFNDVAVTKNFATILIDLQMTHQVDSITLDKQDPSFGFTINWYIQSTMFLRRVFYIFYLNSDCDEEILEMVHITSYVSGATQELVKDDRYTRKLFLHSLQQRTGQIKYLLVDGGYQSDLNSVPKAVQKSAQTLSCEQLAGLFLCYRFWNLNAAQQWMHKFQGPAFPLDPSSTFFLWMMKGDAWKIKQHVAALLIPGGRRPKHLNDPSLVSIEVLKSNLCYKPVLEKISSDGTRVLMNENGEITFVPVKHCRWCGLIQAEKFQMCALCKEFVEYCDVNYFCSEKCELEALSSKHREEHARYYEVKLGFEDEANNCNFGNFQPNL